jgi:dihydroxyacetone kinase-like protein
MGVALSACSLPQTRRPNFDLPAGEMEIGMGIHGEPGVRRGPLKPADAVVDEIIDALLAEMAAGRGDRVAVLVNSLGSTPLMELYILHARVAERLADAGLGVHRALVGPYCTSLEMAGASITLMHLDDTLTPLLDHPCTCAMFRQ